MVEHVLEKEGQAFADATARPPYLYEIGPDAARKVLEDVQSAPVVTVEVDESWVTVPADVGDVRVRILRPPGATGVLPVILYVHGGGWILGDAATHDRLTRELCAGAGAALAFVEYDRSPEAAFPVAVEQAYATARWIVENAESEALDAGRLAVAGDSVGGCMATAVALLARRRGDVAFVHQSLYYPVTDGAQDTDSYREFADGPFLTAASMAWFWDAYTPDPAVRSDPIVSPLRASDEELAGLPETFIVVDENDVLRDEGEAYGRRLTRLGVRTTSVRYNGILHDFLMVNPLRSSAAAAAAIAQAVHVLGEALGTHGRSE
ncbi:alpha/beta hydrolase [Oerskovia flava]|uniref:alpha/beta hydrolase n=1 Tax=Oerskovia flava TaxID=2986422 RepID=UPI00223F0641|nr:alpha/beta hydrolase [Oerskovia sp. JB1-3-2]